MPRHATPSTESELQSLIQENIAEVALAVGALGAAPFEAMARHPRAQLAGASDLVREAIIDASASLARLELADKSLWTRHCWPEVADAIAAAIATGALPVDLQRLLR